MSGFTCKYFRLFKGFYLNLNMHMSLGMKHFWLLSSCLKIDSRQNGQVEFHFKGLYRGEIVNKVVIYMGQEYFGKGKTYLLLLNETTFLSGALHAELVKYREIPI